LLQIANFCYKTTITTSIQQLLVYKHWVSFASCVCRGKYKYHRRGLLESIPHIRFIRGVIVVRGVDLGVVVDFLNKYNAELWVWDVTLSSEDEKTLTREP